jgi:hypothetical protein
MAYQKWNKLKKCLLQHLFDERRRDSLAPVLIKNTNDLNMPHRGLESLSVSFYQEIFQLGRFLDKAVDGEADD